MDAGSRDPLDDIKFLEDEIAYWIKQLVERTDWEKFVRTTHMTKTPVVKAMLERLSGIGINETQILASIKRAGLSGKNVVDWNDEDKLSLARALQSEAKPIIIVANKIDKEGGRENYERIKAMPAYGDVIFPCSALAEFYLRTYAKNGTIKYTPGDPTFSIVDEGGISAKVKTALDRIQTDILDIHGSTGVQSVLDKAIFDVLDYIYVYPVQDPNKLTDHDGRILPDVFLVKNKTKLIDFVASKIHTDLAKAFIHGINVKNKRRLSDDYELQPDDVVKVVSAK